MISNFGQSEVLIVTHDNYKVDENTLNFFKMYVSSADNVIKEHEQCIVMLRAK